MTTSASNGANLYCKLAEGKAAFLSQKDTSKTSEKQPNIIILLADDLGKYDISLYG